MGDLVRAHRSVADDHQLMVAAELVDHAQGRRLFDMAAAVVLPHPLVDAVMEVEMLEMLELGPAGREQLLAKMDMAIHRSADIEEQQQLDGIVPLRPQTDIEPAAAGG